MIKFSDVTIKYGRKTACEGVSFTAENGKVTVLLGRNGSGKSSLLKAAVGILKYSGSIEKDGAAAYMPQVLPLTEMTVEELVLCAQVPKLTFGARPSADDIRKTEDIIAKTGLWELRDSPVAQLSGGERQRAYFAMILAQTATTVLLDEPTANLDTENRQMVYDYIERFKAEGKAVLLVMHHKTEASRLADKIIDLNENK